MTSLQQVFNLVAKCEANPANALRYFKTTPGSYGAHDKFLGISTPNLRSIARQFPDLALADLKQLLASAYNEHRELALFIAVNQYQQGDSRIQKSIFNFYLDNLAQINNWNLVDVSAHLIIGDYLFKRERSLITKLAHSSNLWERRIAMVATLYFIRQKDLATTFKIALMLLGDKEDLIHKAVGWMLREAGKVNQQQLADFLTEHGPAMARTSLRYAIERFPNQQRLSFLAIKSA